jgi:hypothetical protein
LVSLTLARGEVPVMIAWRLFLPASWTSDAARLMRAGVPVEYQTVRSKPEIAVAEIDRATARSCGCISMPQAHDLTGAEPFWPASVKAPSLSPTRPTTPIACGPISRHAAQFRRIATRYDKLGVSFLAFIQLAAVRISLRSIGSTTLVWRDLTKNYP